MREKIYLVWSEPDTEGDKGYWNQYEDLDDAVSANKGIVEVFVCHPRRVGKFKMKTGAVRVKSRKPKGKK